MGDMDELEEKGKKEGEMELKASSQITVHIPVLLTFNR